MNEQYYYTPNFNNSQNDILRKYFPRSYTPRQMEEKIIQLLDAWQKKQQRHNER